MKYVAFAFLLYCVIALIRTPGEGYGAKVLFFLDLFICGLIWRMPDITISSMCGLELRRPNPAWWAKAISDFCDVFEADHCEKAIAADAERAHSALQTLTQGVQ